RKTQGKPPCVPLQPSATSRPFERVARDILGPLPETPSKNRYILVVGDYFSKWTEAFPLPNQEASSIAKVLKEEWVCRFGVPRSIHSDQGRNFESTLFRELCRLLKIHKTSPYHAQSDGLIERFNRILLSMLSLFVEDNQLNWDTLLPYVMLAYRSSVHANTAFTPYKVLFGREIVLPIDIMLNLGSKEQFSSANDYVSRLSETLSTVVAAVKRHQARASERQKNSYDFRAIFQYYSEGELVWLQNKARKRGLCPKLQRRYKGPFRVVERVTDVLYKLMLVEGGPECVVHFNRLKPYTSSLTATRDPVFILENRNRHLI
uniref:Integrase catalytic domain-containing protein n=1 Tax=Seriola lalandi dorsalis TaxID=1841481 RepID=A0A3B4WPR7_SERLL